MGVLKVVSKAKKTVASMVSYLVGDLVEKKVGMMAPSMELSTVDN